MKVASSDGHAAQHVERLRRRGKTLASFCKAPEGRPIFIALPPDGFKFFSSRILMLLIRVGAEQNEKWVEMDGRSRTCFFLP